MVLPDEVQVDSFTINVHIAGDGFGEALVITVGRRFLIGIDCCEVILQKGEDIDHFLETELKKLRKDAYKFWLLSHYHYDHFQSFAELLSVYKSNLSSLIYPADFTSADFAYMAGISTSTKHLAEDEYAKLRDVLDKGIGRNFISLEAGNFTWMKTNLIDKTGKKKKFLLEVYAPSAEESKKIRSRSLKDVLSPDKKNKISRANANAGSYIIHLVLGSFEALFLADAPFKRTAKINWGKVYKKNGITLLKVAHHGSNDGTNEAFLASLKGVTHTTFEKSALLAPFDHYKLPKKNIIDLLKAEDYAICISKTPVSSEKLSAEIETELKKMTLGICTESKNIIVKEVSTPRDNITTVAYAV